MLATVGGGGRGEVDVLFPKTKRPKTFFKHYFLRKGGGLKFSISDLFRPQFSRKFFNINIKEFSRKLRSKKV